MAQMTALSRLCLDESFTIRMPIEGEKMPEGGKTPSGGKRLFVCPRAFAIGARRAAVLQAEFAGEIRYVHIADLGNDFLDRAVCPAKLGADVFHLQMRCVFGKCHAGAFAQRGNDGAFRAVKRRSDARGRELGIENMFGNVSRDCILARRISFRARRAPVRRAGE